MIWNDNEVFIDQTKNDEIGSEVNDTRNVLTNTDHNMRNRQSSSNLKYFFT